MKLCPRCNKRPRFKYATGTQSGYCRVCARLVKSRTAYQSYSDKYLQSLAVRPKKAE